MVLSASAPPDAPAPGEHGLVERLGLILRLAEGGVLVLVDRGRPEQLGAFVRAVMALEPRVEVHTSALALARAEPGSAIVLLPDVAEAAWMNQERPVLAHRRLRVMMFADAATSGEIARRAPDFFHWTSHWMEAPQGAWPPAVLGLRAAAAQGVAAVWAGGDLEGTFAAAFPGETLSRRSAAGSYAELVEAFQSEAGWIALTEVSGPFRMRRVRWALAESGRKGKVVLVEPGTEAPGFLRVGGRPMGAKEAIARLGEAGVRQAGRLAAVLDLEPEAVEIAEKLLGAGVEEGALEAVWREEDPGAALVRVAMGRGIAVEAGAPRGRAGALQEGKPDTVVDALTKGVWVVASLDASRWGDFEAAEHFAQNAAGATEERASALASLGVALAQQGKLDEAEQRIKESLDIHRAGQTSDAAQQIFLLEAQGKVQQLRGNLKEARRSLEKALHVEKSSSTGEESIQHVHLLASLAEILVAQGDIEGARRILSKAISLGIKVLGSDMHPSVATALHELGGLRSLGNDLQGALKDLKRALEIRVSCFGWEHPDVSASLHELGRVLHEQGELANAEECLSHSLSIKQLLGITEHVNYAATLHELGRVLFDKGDLDAAGQLFEEALDVTLRSTGGRRSPSFAHSLHDLANVSVARGDFEHARTLLEEALAIERGIYGSSDHHEVATTEFSLGSVLVMLGELERGRPLLRRAHKTFLRKLGPDHPRTQELAALLARIR